MPDETGGRFSIKFVNGALVQRTLRPVCRPSIAGFIGAFIAPVIRVEGSYTCLRERFGWEGQRIDDSRLW